MNNFKNVLNIGGWLTFGLALIVYFMAAERTGSLWDCGEFILGAYKLQVVHPPGASLFLIIARIFAAVGDMLSADPSNIAFAVNIMSGILTACTGMFICWGTMYMGKMILVGRGNSTDRSNYVLLLLAGLVGGLSAAFTASVWFSAVEGEVYAMSTFFSAMTLWAVLKWYYLPERPENDHWLVFAVFAAGLSIGVHLLSLLVFPAMGVFYYLKKYEKTTLLGIVLGFLGGVIGLAIMQKVIITGLPSLMLKFDMFMVNTLGLPFNSGLILLILVIGGLLYWGLRKAHREGRHNLQLIMVSLGLVVVAYSTTVVSVIRANANPPINMNAPTDAGRLMPYLNREQYGDRPLLFGPHYMARPIDYTKQDRYGKVGDRYEVVDYKYDPVYDPADKMFFPRMGLGDDNTKVRLYEQWMGHPGPPTLGDNFSFFFRFQIGWMYWRYFMWNFAGKQNGEQGYYPWDYSKGNWISGIPFIDNMRLGDQSQLPEMDKQDQSKNKYYLIPFVLGIIGMVYQYKKRRKDMAGLLAMFLMTGLGIIIYTNQPPIEPRERDYVLVGSFFTFAIWIGLGVMGIASFLINKVKLNGQIAMIIGGVIGLLSPILMVSQNMDDLGRQGIYASRDYASNFLNSVAPNAIIFTYGDNDTYPLWYCQEVEGIRTDVRVVNLSLISVDWYIESLRRKVNNSPAIKLTIPSDAIRGNKRNQLFYVQSPSSTQPMDALAALKFMGENHPIEGASSQMESYIPSNNLYISVNREEMIKNKLISSEDSAVGQIPLNLNLTKQGDYITKDDLAILDVVASNINTRPVYFAVTCSADKYLGLAPYMQLEGLASRVFPVKTAPDRQFGTIGYGRVQTDSIDNNVMKKWRWGNLDKQRHYVDRSYGASVQAMRMVMLRTAYQYLQNDNKEKAAEMAEKILTVFPNMNFAFDGSIVPAIAVLGRAGSFAKAEPYILQLAKNMKDKMVFYNSLDPEDRAMGYDIDFDQTKETINDIYGIIAENKDTKMEAEVDKILGPYKDKAKDALKPAIPDMQKVL